MPDASTPRTAGGSEALSLHAARADARIFHARWTEEVRERVIADDSRVASNGALCKARSLQAIPSGTMAT